MIDAIFAGFDAHEDNQQTIFSKNIGAVAELIATWTVDWF
jgi:hypothetical protein